MSPILFDPSKSKVKPAIMYDSPGTSGPGTFKFEVCAVCRRGKDQGKVYGCLEWGFIITANGQYQQDPRVATQSPKPSKDWWEAIVMWNKQCDLKDINLRNTSPGSTPQQLPIDYLDSPPQYRK